MDNLYKALQKSSNECGECIDNVTFHTKQLNAHRNRLELLKKEFFVLLKVAEENGVVIDEWIREIQHSFQSQSAPEPAPPQ